MIDRAEEPRWHKSASCSGSTCVEVAQVDDRVLIRDSKDANSAILTFTEAEWLDFVVGVKAGNFSFE